MTDYPSWSGILFVGNRDSLLRHCDWPCTPGLKNSLPVSQQLGATGLCHNLNLFLFSILAKSYYDQKVYFLSFQALFIETFL